MRFVARLQIIAALAVLIGAGACVDHEANAISFCRAVDGVVDVARDNEELTSGRARKTADDFAVSMRDAEDATRNVRKAARDTSVAYDELAALLGDDEAGGDEIAEVRTELQEAREDLRRACADTRG